MGYFSRLALERRDRPLREDHSVLPNTHQLVFYLEDLLSALEGRGVSRETLCSGGAPLWEYYNPHARYHYYEVLFAGKTSIRDLVAAAGEAALRLREEQPSALDSFFMENPPSDPFEQARLIA